MLPLRLPLPSSQAAIVSQGSGLNPGVAGWEVGRAWQNKSGRGRPAVCSPSKLPWKDALLKSLLNEKRWLGLLRGHLQSPSPIQGLRRETPLFPEMLKEVDGSEGVRKKFPSPLAEMVKLRFKRG